MLRRRIKAPAPSAFLPAGKIAEAPSSGRHMKNGAGESARPGVRLESGPRNPSGSAAEQEASRYLGVSALVKAALMSPSVMSLNFSTVRPHS